MKDTRAETCNYVYKVASGIFVNSSLMNDQKAFYRIAASLN